MPDDSMVFRTGSGIPGRVDFRHFQFNKPKIARIIRMGNLLSFNFIAVIVSSQTVVRRLSDSCQTVVSQLTIV